MANKEFQVRHGLAVNNNVLVANTVTGNVSIGSNTASYKLDVAGTVRANRLRTWNSASNADWDAFEILSIGASSILKSYGDETGLILRSEAGNIILADDRGNVGIGTSSPQAALDVYNASRYALRLTGPVSNGPIFDLYRQNTRTAFIETDSSNNFLLAAVQQGPSLSLRTNGGAGPVDRLVITTDGNVGIGTSAPANKLDVRGTIGVGQSSNSALNIFTVTSSIVGADNHSTTFAGPIHGTNDVVTFDLNRGGGAYGAFDVKFGGISRFLIPGAQLYGDGYINLPTNSNFIFRNNNVEGMRFNANGNLGIGTTTPSAKLHVAGDAIFTGNVTISGNTSYVNTQTLLIGDNLITLNADISSNTPGTEDAGIEVNRGSLGNASFIWDETNDKWDIRANNNNLISVLSTGRVGINTTTPAANLEINATAIAVPNTVSAILSRGYDVNFAIMSSTGHAVNDPGSLVGRFGLRYLTDSSDSASLNFYRGGGSLDGSIGVNTNGIERMRIDSGGNVGIGVTNTGGWKFRSHHTNNAAMMLYNTVGLGNRLYFVDQGWQSEIEGINGELKFKTGGTTNRMQIDAWGNVSIGSTASVAGLYVARYGSRTASDSSTYYQPSGRVHLVVGNPDIGDGNGVDKWLAIVNGYGYTSGSVNILLQGNQNDLNQQCGHYIGSEIGVGAHLSDLTFGRMVSSGSLSGRASKSEQMRITSGGDVMINQTSSSGTGKLGVAGRIAIDVNGSDSFSGQLYLSSPNAWPSNIQAAGPSSNGIAFWTYTGSWSERMRITGAGNVGIGTTTPGESLEVNGSIFVNKENSGFIVDAAGGKRVGLMKYGGHEGVIARVASQDFGIVRTGSTLANTTLTYDVYVSGTGDVGIGTVSPASLFNVNAGASGGGAIFSSQGFNYATVSQIISSADAVFGGGVIASNVGGELIKTVANDVHYFKAQITDGLTFHTGITGSAGTAVPRTTNERMRINANGNVGIGTTSPAHKLDVLGNVRVYNSLYNDSVLTIGATSGSVGTQQRIVFNDGTNQTGGIFSYGSAYGSGFSNGISIGTNVISNTSLATSFNYAASTVASLYSQLSGAHIWYNAASGTAGNAISWSERMRIDASGNVGIGVTSVTAKFVSSGTARIGTLTTDYAGDVQLSADYVRIWNPGNAPAGQIRFGINQETTIRGQALVGLMFDTDGSERMRIANTGNIGIGTTSPSYRLDVNAAVANGVRFDGARPITFNSNGLGEIRIKASSGGWSTGYLFSGSAGTDIGGFGAYGGSDSLTYHWVGSAYNTPTAVFTPGGNVAIGQTSAPERLTVFRDTDNSAAIGRAHIGYVGYPDYAGFSHVDMNSPGNYALLQGSDGKTFLNSASGQAIYFRQNNTDKMILDYLGNLGIGTNSPTSRLHIVKDFAATSPENSNKKPMRKRWVHTTQQGANGYTYTVCTISRDPLNWDEYSPVEILARNTYFQGGSYSRWIFTHGYGVNPSLVCVETGGVSGNIPNLYLGSEVTVNSNLKYTPIYCDVPYYREFNFEFSHNYTEVSSITSLSQIKFDNVYTANASAAMYSGDIALVSGGGNVGIGTSSPVGKLSVAGNILAPTFNSNTSYTIGIQDAQVNSFVNSKRGSLIIQASSATTTGADAMGGGDLTLKAGNSYSSTTDIDGDLNLTSGYNTVSSALSRGKIRFTTNNTERMRIDANGNIGIGVSNPASVLSVHGSNSSDGTARYTMNILNTAVPSAGVGSGLMFGTNISSASVGADNIVGMAGIEGIKENGTSGNYASALKFTTRINGGALTERLRITSNGNIGIGTSGPIEYNNTSISMTIQGPSFASINLRDAASSTRTELGAAPTESFLKSVSSLPLNFYTSNIERMRITSDGNIGIGISAPGKRVEISEDNSSTTLTTGLLISNINGTTDSRAGIVFKSYDNLGCSIWSRRTGGYAGDLCFGTKPNSSGSISEVGITERMRINGDGNVGIGTASPGLYTGHTTLAINNATYGGLIDLLTNGTRHLTLYSGTAASIIGTVSSTALTFLSHNTERMRIDSAGNVGIGTSAPQTRLHVGTKITDDAGYTYDSNTFMAIHQSPTGTSRLNDPKTVMMLARQGWGGEAYGAAVAFDLSRYENSGVFSRTRLDITLANNNFIAQNTTVMTLLSSGNVGIGTTSPGAKLHVTDATGTASTVLARFEGAGGRFVRIIDNDGSGGAGVQTTRVYGDSGGSGTLRLYNTYGNANRSEIAIDTSYVAINTSSASTSTERMRIDTNGNIGIGTTTPSQRLTVAGGQILVGPADNGNSYINFYSTSYRVGASGGLEIQTASGDVVRFLRGSTETARIDGAGNVGIGTTTPAYKLQVNGSFAATTKSFVIDHPTKPGMKLRHGSLEGPENGVYVRGKTKEKVIELPEYWRGLVDSNTITVQLTAIGRSQNLYVVDVSDNRVYIDSENYTDVDCYYYIQAERKDVEKLVVEY